MNSKLIIITVAQFLLIAENAFGLPMFRHPAIRLSLGSSGASSESVISSPLQRSEETTLISTAKSSNIEIESKVQTTVTIKHSSNNLPEDVGLQNGDSTNLTGDSTNFTGDSANFTGDSANFTGDSANFTGDSTNFSGDTAGASGSFPANRSRSSLISEEQNNSRSKNISDTSDSERTGASGASAEDVGDSANFTGDSANFTGDSANFTGNSANFTGDSANFTGDSANFTGDSANFTGNSANFTGDSANFTGDSANFTGNSANFTGDSAKFTGDSANFTVDTTGASGSFPANRKRSSLISEEENTSRSENISDTSDSERTGASGASAEDRNITSPNNTVNKNNTSHTEDTEEHTEAAIDPCEIPADIHVRFERMLETLDPSHPPLYLPPTQDLLNKTYTEEDMFEGMDNVKHHLWKKNSAICNSRTINDLANSLSKGVPGYNMEERSLCPWYYKLDVNPFRYPTVMVSSECQCSGCVGYGEGFHCAPVMYDLPVLKRQSLQCVNGFYEYKQEKETYSMGCTCVKK